MDTTAPNRTLLALDWGTSSLRAFRMQAGRVLDVRQAADGIQPLATQGRAGFERAFAAITEGWLHDAPAVVACGMVGSAQGWREAPYVPCPADLASLATRGATVASGAGPEIVIAPGLLYDPPGGTPDVMRGEETQVAGALLAQPAWREAACIVLPGTHSKWVAVEGGRIVRFATYLTGETFALLKTHSILGRLMQEAAAPDDVAFVRGLDLARASGPGDLLHQAFAVRTLGLTRRLPPDALADLLSGLLIGHELVSALAAQASVSPRVLVGDSALCARYARALQHFGQPAAAVLDNTAPQGLWALARAAGLV